MSDLVSKSKCFWHLLRWHYLVKHYICYLLLVKINQWNCQFNIFQISHHILGSAEDSEINYIDYFDTTTDEPFAITLSKMCFYNLPRFIEPGWSIPRSRQMHYNIKGSPRNSTYIGADFSLLEFKTSYIGFEFPTKPSICPR